MTYPQPRYQGSGGEHTARYRPADHEPELRYPAGTTVHYLATGASTDGDFGLYRWDMGPDPSGPGPHGLLSLAGAGAGEPERDPFFAAHDNHWL